MSAATDLAPEQIGCVGCVPRLEATALAPESSVYILYAVYLGTHGTRNIFLLMHMVKPIGNKPMCKPIEGKRYS